jgi:NADPH:quinone reductase-like Zn-dependent oxidoreductase
VGTASIQIAKVIGARIAVTCSAGKMELCRALGADLVLERSPSEWLAEALAVVPEGFDTILDVIGGEEVDRNLQAVALKGHIVQVGTMAGGTVPVNVSALMRRRATWTGTVLRARPLEEKATLTRRFAAEMLPLFESGHLKPVIDSRFPFERIGDAHRHMAANANAGKIIIDIEPA